MDTLRDRNDAMQQQMLFARPETWQAWTGSDSSSPRRVTFAVQDAIPSPVVFRSRQPPTEQSPYAADLTEELPLQQRQRWPRRQHKQQRNIVSSAKPTAATKTRSRRPGWDDDTSHNPTLFDTSLKKSLLFQPRAGDRRKEETEAAKKQRAMSSRTASLKWRTAAAVRTSQVRYRSGPSSAYAQQRQETAHWPQRRTKDFVRENIERLTGRPVDARIVRREAQSHPRENVFERLSAPRVSRALLRSLSMETERERTATPVRSPSVSSFSPSKSTPASSPVLTIDPPAPDKQDSLRLATPSPQIPRSGRGWSSPHLSPQQSQLSLSSRHSPAPRSNSANRNSGAGSRTQRHDNYPSRVFEVLDRDNEGRIGGSQILQGLRLLGLPATHNQISDYVYLIHEGRHNSIDLEEWEILVGTLDAASRPSSDSSRTGHGGRGSTVSPRSPSLHSFLEHSPHSIMPPSNSPYSRGNNPSSRTPKRQEHLSVASTRHLRASLNEEDQFSTSIQREAIVSSQHQPIQNDDPYLVEIQNRIEGMFERAQATAALRWAPEPGNNQFENDPDHSKSDRILKRAASVVYSLRASLFPLVHQAEATLREIQQRHGSKLSLFLPPGDMAAIAQNSDVLASAILDDILLDTVQLLNDDDKQQSCRQLETRHADQLDDILIRIQEIEQEENDMIHQGLALSYNISGAKCALPTASLHRDLDRKSAKPAQRGGMDLPNLTLPLDVVMNINIPDSEIMLERHQDPGNGVNGSSALTGDEYGPCELETSQPQLLFAETPVKTSILQGKRLQSIERKRHKFEHHRRLVESSLAETGMAQFAVVEILEEMLLDDLVEETTAELNDTVVSMSDTLLTNLL